MTSNSNDFEQRCRQAHCRSCGRTGLVGVLDLGMMPLSDGLLNEVQLAAVEDKYPLEVATAQPVLWSRYLKPFRRRSFSVMITPITPRSAMPCWNIHERTYCL